MKPRLAITLVSTVLAILVVWTALRLRAEQNISVSTDLRPVHDLLSSRAEERAGERAVLAGTRRLVREPIDEASARILFPSLTQGTDLFDPVLYVRRRPEMRDFRRLRAHPRKGWVLRTNDIGIRRDGPISAERPDVRVLVAGDSHTEGVCDNKDSFAGRLEARLQAERPGETVEVVNLGKGGTAMYRYLAALEGFLELKPDVFIVCVYDGNDYVEGLLLKRYFEREVYPDHGPGYGERMQAANQASPTALAQALGQAAYFADLPQEEAVAIDAAVAVAEEIQRVCRENDIELLIATLAPPRREWLAAQGRQFVGAARELGIDPWDRSISDRLSAEFRARVAALGIEAVDVRPAFEGESDLYWDRDFHLNLRGNERVADVLLPALRRRLER